MRSKGVWLGITLLVAAVLGLGYAGWRTWRTREAQICQVCSRPVHSHTRTVGMVGDRRELFCCPACALTAHEQTGRPVRIIGLTDHETDSTLAPDQAYVVRGSDVNPCAQHQGHVDPDKQPTVVAFDRCAPSLLAFARQAAAARFAREHGGAVLKFSDLQAEYSQGATGPR